MAKSIQSNIKKSIQDAEGLYYRLVLLVGENGSGKTGVLRDIANDLNIDVVNVNLSLSAELLELTAKQRTLRLSELLDNMIKKNQGIVVLDNLEILFDKDLKQDPLRLLQSMSRNRIVLASWNGKISGNKLIYAEISHPEYRSYDIADTLVVTMDEPENKN